MKSDHESEKSKGTGGITDSIDVTFMKLDLSSLKSTEEFIQEFKAKESKLHTLILNAAVTTYELGKYHMVLHIINFIYLFLNCFHNSRRM